MHIGQQEDYLAQTKRRGRPDKNPLIRILNTRSYRRTADSMVMEHDSMPLTAGTEGLLDGKAPGAPDLQAGIFPFGEKDTVRVELNDNDYELVA